MGTGISMSSVNKIKELAENGDYSLALDILEHQDLSKSLSPQFIRICGEVYFENKKYAKAREALVRAHAMAPVGNKIVYSLINLYLTMGYRTLAEKYYEIFKFNQDSKDVFTLRVEYMIAKSYRKPVNELYSILLAANDIESDEQWDFEMLLLHAYIRNKEKFQSACIEFKANHKNSSRLYMLDNLMSGDTDLESMIYCYPEEEIADEDPSQESIRLTEAKVLEEDDLRLHPKDAKIMIMVEDDAPVSSSMKIKQMFIRSKDKKELKKEQKKEQKLEDDSISDDTKKQKKLFGRLSKKEDALIKQEFEELSGENIDREKLLEEVITGNDDHSPGEADSGDANKAFDHTDSVPDQTDYSKPVGQASDIPNIMNTEYELKEMPEEDTYVLEEEPEELVMVNFDEAFDEDFNEPNVSAQAGEPLEEEFDEVFSQDEQPADFENSFDEDIQAEDYDEEVQVEESVELAPVEEFVEEAQTEDFDGEFDEEFQEEALGVDEQTESFDEDFDAAFDTEIPEDAFETDAKTDILYEIDDATIEKSEDSAETIDDNLDEDSVDEKQVNEEESGDDMKKGFDFEKAYEALAEFEVDESLKSDDASQTQNDSDNDSDISDASIDESDSDVLMHSVQEANHEDEGICKEEAIDTHKEPKKDKEFPVFKSSLFPDYNTDNAQLYDIKRDSGSSLIDEKEAEINENLKKEEDLLSETDKLLARLGIKLNTEFNSIFDFNEEDNANVEEDTTSVGAASVADNSKENEKAYDEQKTDDESDGLEGHKKKRSFTLKGHSK